MKPLSQNKNTRRARVVSQGHSSAGQIPGFGFNPQKPQNNNSVSRKQNSVLFHARDAIGHPGPHSGEELAARVEAGTGALWSENSAVFLRGWVEQGPLPTSILSFLFLSTF